MADITVEQGGNIPRGMRTRYKDLGGYHALEIYLSELPAGENNIGDVDIASALPAGTNSIGSVSIDGTATVNGAVEIDAALPAGDNNIGNVDIASEAEVASAELVAARAGRAFCRKLNKKTNLATQTVLTDAGLLQTTATGFRDVITCLYAHINTDTDWLELEIGYTANADGSGTFTALTPLFRLESPTNNDAAAIKLTQLHPPIVIDSDDGGAWTIRAQTNDNSTSVTLGANGWREAT